ncbi:MAG TPA: Gfo/Idh/MocA family oxidoreductase [Aggregatilineales bacterium]|nr:Gfo/Idh/MocA family oxidoreductase [Aggregatilineales bacterium]
MVEIGIIGAGFAGSIHARAYAKTPDAHVAVVVDQDKPRAEALAGEVGGRAETDIDALLRDSALELVDVAVPTPLHPRFAIRALEAGKHVVIEKPLALTVAECDAILKAGQRSGKFVMVGHVLRFWPEYRAIRTVIQSGKLGHVMVATAHRLSNRPQWASWFHDPQATGGALLDLQIHDVDMLNSLFGRPRRVFALGAKGENGGWDHVVTQIEYDTLTASAEASFMMPQDFPFTAGLRVTGDKGVVEYQFRAGGASFEMGEPVHYLYLHEAGKPNQPLDFEGGDAFESEIAHFVSCVKRGQPSTVVTPGDARLAVQTALAARASLESHQPVGLDEVEP